MGLFGWLGGLFDNDNGSMDTGTTINPASGLPMISGDTSGVDVGGNPYGMDKSVDFSNSGDSSINSDSDFMNNDFGSSDSFATIAFLPIVLAVSATTIVLIAAVQVLAMIFNRIISTFPDKIHNNRQYYTYNNT